MSTEAPPRVGPKAGLAVAFLAALALGAGLFPTQARACDSCNDSLMHELHNARSGTPMARDVLAAVENQRGLPLGPSARGNGAASNPASARLDDIFDGADFIEIIRRDEGLSIPATSFVPQDVEPDHHFTITLDEGLTYLGQGVMYDGFLADGGVPGQTLRVTEGDIVKFTVVNTGTVPHGASIHAAYTQTSKYVGQIAPGETKSVTFRATVPGVYMWHCAPGGHAIPMHVLFGQYGMIVVEPRDRQYRLEQELGRKPDLTIYLLQNEFYTSGREAVDGHPAYTAFNGQPFRYIENPITARPGDYVRIYYLNVGPNLVSTFHLVGIIWDYVYWQGHPDAWMPGGQTVTSGPSDSWVIEFRVPPDEGAYTMLSHSVGPTSRGAIGLLVADRNADTPKTVLADGPQWTEEELAEKAANATRTISPFAPGFAGTGMAARADRVVSYGPEVEEVVVEIIGNSYHPKVIEIEPGTRVTWVNEDVFTYLAGEFSGVHNAVGMRGPKRFATPLLGHGETGSVVFDEPGEYDYICTPHPYMKGRIIVRER
ncbi:MAG: plastocyanin/azurin family copper-binding protein [Lysobacteraceae bacterium]|jgi:nitrite reductase (NO-forming)